MGRGEYWRLVDSQGRPPGLLGMWPSRAVTFIENHDTGAPAHVHTRHSQIDSRTSASAALLFRAAAGLDNGHRVTICQIVLQCRPS